MIYIILIINYIADFLLQSREIATKKSKSLPALLKHVSTLGIFMFVTLAICYKFENLYGVFAFSMVNMLLHGITDFFTSKWTSHLYKNEKIKQFFDVIGFDQLIHVITILMTYDYFLL